MWWVRFMHALINKWVLSCYNMQEAYPGDNEILVLNSSLVLITKTM